MDWHRRHPREVVVGELHARGAMPEHQFTARYGADWLAAGRTLSIVKVVEPTRAGPVVILGSQGRALLGKKAQDRPSPQTLADEVALRHAVGWLEMFEHHFVRRLGSRRALLALDADPSDTYELLASHHPVRADVLRRYLEARRKEGGPGTAGVIVAHPYPHRLRGVVEDHPKLIVERLEIPAYRPRRPA